MAIPCSSAAAITCGSRVDPPVLHDGPDSRVGRGVYAVPEREEGVQREWQPATSRLASAAFLMASSEASTRLT